VKIYVGNMSYDTTEEALRQAFESFGEVVSVNIITDRETGRPKGFGFIEMSTEEAGRSAIAEMNGKELDGRNLNVNEARPRTDSGPRRRSW
jgi:RNA recognition motif-containing protein